MPKRAGVVVIVMNCILFCAFVDVSIDRKNMHGVDSTNLHIKYSVSVLHQYTLK
jgi:hypothetical protein